MLVKVDFEKAYDCVSWDYLRYIMRMKGFGIRGLKWMEALVFIIFMPVLVNCSLNIGFQA